MANSIINSDNGSTSGSAGLKFTSGDDGVLQIQNNGTTAMTVSATGQSTFAAPVSQPGAFMFRNKLINGNFDIWQRATSQTTSGYGSADRWKFSSVGSTHSTSLQAFALGQTDVPGEPTYFVRHAVTSSVGSSNYSQIEQRIESVRTLAGRNATLSFYAKADATKNIALELVQDFGTDGSPSADVTGIGKQLIALTDSWQKYTVTVAVPSISGKTAGTTDDGFLSLIFWLDAGTDFNTRASSLGQQSGTFDMAQLQIEEGTAATPFEMRPIGTELSLCQRYFEKNSLFLATCANGGLGNSYAAGISFSIKRTTPTITAYSGTNLAGTQGSLTWYPSGTVASTTTFTVQPTHAIFQRTGTNTHNVVTGSFTADAEL